MKFLVWCPDRGENEESATSLDSEADQVDHSREAAEEYARSHAGFGGDPFDEINVIVKRVPDEGPCKESSWCVEVEAEPTFTAFREPK